MAQRLRDPAQAGAPGRLSHTFPKVLCVPITADLVALSSLSFENKVHVGQARSPQGLVRRSSLPGQPPRAAGGPACSPGRAFLSALQPWDPPPPISAQIKGRQGGQDPPHHLLRAGKPTGTMPGPGQVSPMSHAETLQQQQLTGLLRQLQHHGNRHRGSSS